MKLPSRPTHALDWNFPRRGTQDLTKILVNIVGPNGAGKSMWPKVLHCMDSEAYCVLGENNKTRIATVFPKLGWAAVGAYRSKTGGADCLDKSSIFEALVKLKGTDLNVVLEGSIVSNTKNTYWDAFKAVKMSDSFRVPSFVMMDFSYETYMSRILERNGGKSIKEESLRQKFNNITRYIKYYTDPAVNVPDSPEEIKVHVEKNEGVNQALNSMKQFFDNTIGEDCLKLQDSK